MTQRDVQGAFGGITTPEQGDEWDAYVTLGEGTEPRPPSVPAGFHRTAVRVDVLDEGDSRRGFTTTPHITPQLLERLPRGGSHSHEDLDSGIDWAAIDQMALDGHIIFDPKVLPPERFHRLMAQLEEDYFREDIGLLSSVTDEQLAQRLHSLRGNILAFLKDRAKQITYDIREVLSLYERDHNSGKMSDAEFAARSERTERVLAHLDRIRGAIAREESERSARPKYLGPVAVGDDEIGT